MVAKGIAYAEPTQVEFQSSFPLPRSIAPSERWCYAAHEGATVHGTHLDSVAAASTVLLIFGLVLSNFLAKTQAMSVVWPGSNTAHSISYQVPCYGLAGLFAVFACFYGIGWIPLSKSIVAWHLWLSFSGVAMFVIGFALLARVASEGGAVPDPGRKILLTIAGGMLLGPATFFAGQVLLMIALLARFATQYP